jgi:hypothetical protein
MRPNAARRRAAALLFDTISILSHAKAAKKTQIMFESKSTVAQWLTVFLAVLRFLGGQKGLRLGNDQTRRAGERRPNKIKAAVLPPLARRPVVVFSIV